MSIKPVAWTPWESAGYVVFSMKDGVQHHIASVHRYEHVPLVKSAPELAEALRNLLEATVDPMCYHPDAPGYQAAKEAAISLLARITPK